MATHFNFGITEFELVGFGFLVLSEQQGEKRQAGGKSEIVHKLAL